MYRILNGNYQNRIEAGMTNDVKAVIANAEYIKMLEIENAALKKMADFVKHENIMAISTIVDAEYRDIFGHRLIIAAGRIDGVANGASVFTTDGIVGIVSLVYEKYSVVHTILDPKSKIPIEFPLSRCKGFAVAANYMNSDKLEVKYIDTYDLFDEETTAITFSTTPLIQGGLFVGHALKNNNDKIYLKPQIKWGKLKYVFVSIAR